MLTLNEALRIGNARKGATPVTAHVLVCGFEPLHLATLLRAHLLQRVDGDVVLTHGLYGDFLGSLSLASTANASGATVVLEWSDVDPRLGLRASGGWTRAAREQILADVPSQLARIEARILEIAARMLVAVVPPSIGLPPIGGTVGNQLSQFELSLEHELAAFLQRIAASTGVRVVRGPRAELPPESKVAPKAIRALDARMELMAGFPYTVAHADAVAAAAAIAHAPAVPKKGIITDLDDTLWRGIVGEIGVDAISWSQEHHTQAHGLYQQMLGHLADQGVLVAIASKNERTTVDAALARPDLYVKSDTFFPVEASWGAKSAAVARILETWNIGSDAVVFIDDNQMEIAEVCAAYPGVTGIHFNGKDADGVWQLLATLRDLFGKPVLTAEDGIRRASIRAGAAMKDLAGEQAGSPEFLRGLDGEVTFSWSASSEDRRSLELINKTNQFNLNGKRIAEGDWARLLESDATRLAGISYADKFGPLGKVAVLLGRSDDRTFHVSHWVMSCRAFSRRLEYHALDAIFRTTGAETVVFDYQATDRNGPLQEFMRAIAAEAHHDGTMLISREQFLARAEDLPHRVTGVDR